MCVQVLTQTGSMAFTFDSPATSDAVGNTPDSGGGTITVMGLNFGGHDFRYILS